MSFDSKQHSMQDQRPKLQVFRGLGLRLLGNIPCIAILQFPTDLLT